MSLTVQPIPAGANFRTFRERFNVIVGYLNSSLQDDKHLSDLKDIPASRTTLKVFSKDESDARFLNEESNLSDLPNKETSRVNLEVWSRNQADGRYFEESKLFSEISGSANAAKRRSAANNLDMYIKSDLYTRTMGNERYFETTNGNITSATIDSIFADYKKGGTWNVENQTVAGGFEKYGTLLQFTPNGANRFQIYAPHKSVTSDQLTGASVTESGIAVRSGRDAGTHAWTRLLTTQNGKHMFFEKNRLFDELAGDARKADRETAQNNLDVFNKATSDARYFEESKLFNEIASSNTKRATAASNLDMYRKGDLYTRTESNNRFFENDAGALVNRAALDSKNGTSVSGAYGVTNADVLLSSESSLYAANQSKHGVVTNWSVDSNNFQIYAPYYQDTTDQLTGDTTKESAIYVRTSRTSSGGMPQGDSRFTRLVTEGHGRHMFFEKSKLFSELAGAERKANRESAQTNLDVYKKADVRNNTELDARYYQKTETYTRGEMNARYLNESSNLSDLDDKATSRTNLDVFSKAEATDKFTEHGTPHYAGSNVYYSRIGSTPMIKGSNNELVFVHSHATPDMQVNYTAAPSGTKAPKAWYWRAGSASSWASMNMGDANIHGQMTVSDNVVVAAGKSVKIGTDFLTTRTWTNSQYYTKTVSDGRYFRRTNLNDLFYEIKGGALSQAQRIAMLDNLGVYSKAKIDSEFNTGATTYLSKGSNLTDVPNKSQGLAALIERSGGQFTNARNAIRAGFNQQSDRKHHVGTTDGTVGVSAGNHEHYTQRVFDGSTGTTFGGREYVMKPDDYHGTYGRNVYWDFKHGAEIGSPYTGYNFVNTIAGYSDASGGQPHQLAYGANGRIYHRFGKTDTAWEDFETIAYLSDTVANSNKLGGKDLAWVRNWDNFTNKPNFDDLYIKRKSATAVTGTPTFQNATAMVIGGAAYGDKDSHFYHGQYSGDSNPAYSARHTYTGSDSGANNSYELWMTNSKADKTQQNKVWRIQQDGILRLSQAMTGKSANFDGYMRAMGTGDMTHQLGSKDGHNSVWVKGGANKNILLYLSEQDNHGLYLQYDGIADNRGYIGMRYNNVNKHYMKLHLNNGIVEFNERPTWDGAGLARLTDKVADSSKVGGILPTNFVRKDVDSTIAYGKKLHFESDTEGFSLWSEGNKDETYAGLAGNDWMHMRKTDANNPAPDSGIVFDYTGKNGSTTTSGWWLAMHTNKVEINSANEFWVHGQEVDARYARANGASNRNFAIQDGTARNMTVTTKVQAATLKATTELDAKVVKQDGVALDSRFIRYDFTGSSEYARFYAPKGSYLRIGSSGTGGLLPYANGQCNVGTHMWKFAEMHAVAFYENGSKLTDKYAYKAGHGSQNFAAKDLTVQKVNATVEVKAKKVVIDSTIEIKKNSDGSIGFYL